MAGAAIGAIWQEAGLGALPEARLTGAEPVLPSSFRVDAAAQASIALAGMAAAAVHRARGGPAQAVAVDLADAAAEFRGERLFRPGGQAPAEAWDRIAGAYPCGDGRWVRLHTNFPHHRDGVLRLLGCDYDHAAVAAALLRRDAAGFEQAATEAGLVVALVRTPAEWDAHPQAAVLAAAPLVALERIGEAPPTPLPPLGARPLAGIRVAEMTRVIAGPVAGRVLAQHGAEVLRLIAPGLPTFPDLDAETGRGKRSAFCDLATAAGQAALRGLLAGADVFLSGYRPGALVARGFGPAAVAALRPGILVASLSAYGETGPWGGKRGYDSLVQAATGLNLAEAEAAGEASPRALPCQALDHATGQLLAFAVMAALLRRAREGGSWSVRLSLARTALWLRGLGRLPGGLAVPDPGEALAEGRRGATGAIRSAARLSATPVPDGAPSRAYGADPMRWADG